MEVTLTREELQFLRAFIQGSGQLWSGYSPGYSTYHLEAKLQLLQNLTMPYMPPPMPPIDEEARRRVSALEGQIADLKMELSKQNPNWGEF